MEAGQYSYATELAERYGDFRVLVQLCEETGNRGQLREYMQNYKSQVSLFLMTNSNEATEYECRYWHPQSLVLG